MFQKSIVRYLAIAGLVASAVAVNAAQAFQCPDDLICTVRTKIVSTPKGDATVELVDMALRAGAFNTKADEEEHPAPNPEHRILAIPGLTHNAAFFSQLAKSIQTTYPKVRSFTALTLPGHVLHGQVSGSYELVDYPVVVAKTISSEAWEGPGKFDTIIGHSMGGLITLMTQTFLKSSGDSLQNYGVRSIGLLAPSMPAEIDWSTLKDPNLGALLAASITADPKRNPVVGLSDALWLGMFYAGPKGVVSTAPNLVTEVPLMNTYEPLNVALSLFGAFGTPRPAITTAGHTNDLLVGLNVALVGFAADPYATNSELTALGKLLKPAGVVPVTVSVTGPSGEEGIHTASFTAPQETADALGTILR